MYIDCLQAYSDSQLVVRLWNDQYAIKNATLVPYHERAKYLMSQFHDIHVSHIPSERDIQITVGEHYLLSSAIERTEELVDSNVITASVYEEEPDDLDWWHPIIEYLQHGKLPNDSRKKVSGNKKDWHERLPEALWAYRTTIRNSTGYSPYNLVYGAEAVIPLEVQFPLLRVALQLTNPDENANVRLAELEALDEKRLAAQQRLEIYQAQVTKAFNRKVKFRSYSIGDLVLTFQRPFVITRKMHGKFEPKWEGPTSLRRFSLRVPTSCQTP
ncbi:uncharacterized protein LOC109949658 [Prunus persica]|uniref:uncharacterized protein LOC109949658 n=1 Tax=Prunus persica TaxID=3760 RepID=UPI0009AB9749|nr:uncharacterized protein LOC109949658 [Prunus persica]